MNRLVINWLWKSLSRCWLCMKGWDRRDSFRLRIFMISIIFLEFVWARSNHWRVLSIFSWLNRALKKAVWWIITNCNRFINLFWKSVRKNINRFIISILKKSFGCLRIRRLLFHWIKWNNIICLFHNTIFRIRIIRNIILIIRNIFRFCKISIINCLWKRYLKCHKHCIIIIKFYWHNNHFWSYWINYSIIIKLKILIWLLY
jgi:hypothetical protein